MSKYKKHCSGDGGSTLGSKHANLGIGTDFVPPGQGQQGQKVTPSKRTATPLPMTPLPIGPQTQQQESPLFDALHSTLVYCCCGGLSKDNRCKSQAEGGIARTLALVLDLRIINVPRLRIMFGMRFVWKGPNLLLTLPM